MRCLAVCQDELVIRMLDEILLPSFEIEFLVESKALARRLHDAGVHITAGDLRRTDTFLKADITPEHLRHRRRQRPAQPAQDAGRHPRRRRHADLRAGRRRRGTTRKREEEIKAELPGRDVSGDGGAVRRAAADRVQPVADPGASAAVPALLQPTPTAS